MKPYLAKRNYRSNSEAIQRISSRYGLAKVIGINEDSILEEFIDFEIVPLGPKNLGSLLKKIHSEKNSSGVSLVHGDFGEHNTTIINGEPMCFDYEYTHFGNPYVDIGKVVLRNCFNEDDFFEFFRNYSNDLPKPENFREGLIYFCDWQNSSRLEKRLPYHEIPLIRKERLKKTNKNNLFSLLDAFKSKINIK